MAGVYHPRHPERTVLYRVLFHHFDRFLTEYESRFEREYGFFRPIVKEVVERYLDCGNPRCGFARIRCPDCAEERLVMFSCRTRGFCPSCHAKRVEEWGEWMRETLLLDVAHRQVVFTIPKRLRVFFKFDRRLLGDLCRSALRSLNRYFEIVTGSALRPGVIAVLQTFGDRINLHVHLHFLVTEGGVDEAGVFHKIPRIDDSRLAEIFAREVLAMLVRKELLSPEWAVRILSWRHSGFSVHSLVRAKTKIEAERPPPPQAALPELLWEADPSAGFFPRSPGRICSLIVELGGEVRPDNRLAAAGAGRICLCEPLSGAPGCP